MWRCIEPVGSSRFLKVVILLTAELKCDDNTPGYSLSGFGTYMNHIVVKVR